MAKRFAEVFGVGHVIKISGGKLDGLLVPLNRFTSRWLKGVHIAPENLDKAGALDLIFNPNTDALKEMVEGEEPLNPGERLYTYGMYNFSEYEDCDGLTIPKYSMLYENDSSVGVRGGEVAAESFYHLIANNTKTLAIPAAMGLNVLTVYPGHKEFLAKYQAKGPNYTEDFSDSGISQGIPFDLKLEWVGRTAALGTLLPRSLYELGVFVFLSGLNEGDELNVIALAQEKAAFIPRDSDAWKQINLLTRPLAIFLSDTGGILSDPLYPLAWVFFRYVGAL